MVFRFISGNTLQKALIASKNMKPRMGIINYVSEDTKNYRKIERNYNELISLTSQDYIVTAMKFSTLNFDLKLIDSVIKNSIKNGKKIIIDAENDDNINLYRNISNVIIEKYNREELNILKTFQMYRKDSLDELRDDINYFKKKKNIFFAPKIVRGAYLFTDMDSGNLFVNKNETDESYNNSIDMCNQENIRYSIFATHNMESIKKVMNIIDENKYENKTYIIANLMGMNERFMNSIKKKYKTASYIPYGPYIEMLPYLSRRLYENIDIMKYSIL